MHRVGDDLVPGAGKAMALKTTAWDRVTLG